MAEDIRVSAPGPNGERLEVDLKGRTIAMTSKDLLPLLVVIGAFLGGLLVAKILFLGQVRGHELLAEMTAHLNAHHAKTLELMQAQQRHEDEGRAALQALVHAQTEAIGVLADKVSTCIEGWGVLR